MNESIIQALTICSIVAGMIIFFSIAITRVMLSNIRLTNKEELIGLQIATILTVIGLHATHADFFIGIVEPHVMTPEIYEEQQERRLYNAQAKYDKEDVYQYEIQTFEGSLFDE